MRIARGMLGFATTSPVGAGHARHHASRCVRARETPRACTPASPAPAVVAEAAPAYERRPQPRGSVLISELAVGDEYEGVVDSVGGAGSLWVDLRVVSPGRRGGWRRVRGRLRFEVARRRQLRGGAPVEKALRPSEGVGGRVRVRVKSVQPASARFEVERVRSLVPAEDRGWGTKPGRRALARIKVPEGESRVLLDELAVGDELEGVVVRAKAKGVELDCGVARRGRSGRLYEARGFLQRKRFPGSWASAGDAVLRDDAERVLAVGDRLKVYVRGALAENGFLWLDAAPVSAGVLEEEQRAWKARLRRRTRRPAPDSLAVGDEVRGTTREAAKFGVFVDIGVTTDGLIHYSSMGRYRVGWEDTVKIGADVLVGVRDVRENRVSLELLAMGEDVDELLAAREKNAVVDVSDAFARPSAAMARASPARSATDKGSDDDDDDDDEDEDGTDDDDDEEFDIDDDYLEDKYGDF